MVKGIRVAEGVHEKTPDEITSFSITYASGLVAGEEVDSVLSSSVVVDDQAGLVIDTVQEADPLVNVTVSGGVAKNVYFVVVKVLTNLGQELEGAVKVVVRDTT